MNDLRISLLHPALKAGALDHNRALIELGIRIAASLGSHWIVTPELCISGYQFIDEIGTSWIETLDKMTAHFCALAKYHSVVVFLGHIERGSVNELYNCCFMIDSDGSIVGQHRKINTAAESWCSPGSKIAPIDWNGLRIGILICADAYTPEIAADFQAKGVQILISPAAWGPGLHGPGGEWELRTLETGLPLIVCNRTGRETSLSFWLAESLVIKHGRRLLSYRSTHSALLTFDWSLDRMLPISKKFHVTEL